jgi:hypothetical protein
MKLHDHKPKTFKLSIVSRDVKTKPSSPLVHMCNFHKIVQLLTNVQDTVQKTKTKTMCKHVKEVAKF